MAVSPFTTATVTAGTLVQLAFNDPELSIFVAGMAGGAVRWHYKKEVWRVGLGSVFIGGICAKYLGPIAVATVEKFMGIPLSDDSGKMGAFLMGLGGVAIVKLVLDAIESRGAKPVVAEVRDETGN